MEEEKRKGISGSTLKIIAIISMLIDHIGAALVERKMSSFLAIGSKVPENIYVLDLILRSIGRIAFPIFAFLLVEGFLHTRDVKKYAFRLAVFAVLSEVPFDLAFYGTFFYPQYQNVFFTLLIGIFTMICLRRIEFIECNKGMKIMVEGIVVLFFAAIATVGFTDYGGLGILMIVILYFFRNNRKQQAIAGAVAFFWEIPAPLAFLPIYFYDGRRGLSMKYFFYLFYPLHLILLYLLAVVLKLI